MDNTRNFKELPPLPPLDERVRTFFHELGYDKNVSRCCKKARLDHSWVYKMRKSDANFMRRWDLAVERFHDRLEAAALTRAVDGVEKPVFYLGAECGKIKEYSDGLLTTLLKAEMPKKYQDRSRVDLANADGQPLMVQTSPTQVAREIAFALALGLRNAEAGIKPEAAGDQLESPEDDLSSFDEDADVPDDGSDLA